MVTEDIHIKQTPLIQVFDRIVLYLNNKPLLFLIFYLLTFLFYYPAHGAGFTFDFIGIAHHYDVVGFEGLSSSFAANGFLPVYHLVMFTMYKLFRLNGLPWHIVASGIHAFTALLLFAIIRKLAAAAMMQQAFGIALFSALLFLLNPFQAEAVIWVAAIHYLICACLMLTCLLATLHYAETKKWWLLILIPLLQLIAHFTLEESLVLPVMVAFLIWLAPKAMFKNGTRSYTAMMVLGPQLLAVVIYFGIHYLMMGSFYSHNKGGGGDPFSDINIATLTSNYVKFLLKFLAFLPYAQFGQYTTGFSFVEKPTFAWSAFVALSAGFIFLLYRLKTFREKGKIMFLLFLLYSIALAPVINFPHHDIFPCQNERYGYFASMFLLPLLVILVFQILPRFNCIPIGLFLGISIFFLVSTVGYWHGARVVRDGLISDFRWYDKEHIYILSLPESFQGSWMFQAPADSNMFAQYVEIYTGKNIKPKTREVTQFVMANVHDGVSVEVKSDSVLSIHTVCNGNWLTSVKGTFPHENFDFKTKGDGGTIEMTRKVKLPNSVYIYSEGDKWKEVAF